MALTKPGKREIEGTVIGGVLLGPVGAVGGYLIGRNSVKGRKNVSRKMHKHVKKK